MNPVTASTRDLLLYGLPLLVMLVVSMFKLDEFFGACKTRTSHRTRGSRGESFRSPMMSDPDGRPWTA